MKNLFFGGIHPDGRKELTGGSVPQVAPAPEEVVISMCQHIGAECKPLVKVGDRVGIGQKVGDAEGLCVPAHASVSGTVIAVEERPHPSGRKVMAVVIRNDYQETVASSLEPHLDPSGLTVDELTAIIREAGIAGMGGATFPTHVKYSTSVDAIDTVIVNACECEPYITADDALLQLFPRQVLLGMKLYQQTLNPKRTVLAVEDNKTEAIAAIKKELADFPEIELKVLPTRYPQGAEKQLIRSVTGHEVPAGKLPKDVGCAVFNAGTTAAIYRAVYEGKQLTERIVTVTGEGIKNPQNFIVKIGTTFEHLIHAAGGLSEDTWKVLSGGPMMGTAQGELNVPVMKGTNAILCLTNSADKPAENPICIRCGKCITVCPMHLQPLNLYQYESEQAFDELEQANLFDCIECGCCSYNCPGKLPLTETFRTAKKACKEAKAK